MPSRHTSVRVVVSAGGRDRTARLRFDPSATSGELARALGAGEQPLRIDGVAVAPHRPLGGVALAEGAVVIPHDPPVAPTLRGATGGVAVVGGLDGGRLETISVRATIGRGAGNDLVLESP